MKQCANIYMILALFIDPENGGCIFPEKYEFF
jgi:hypothetical protein